MWYSAFRYEFPPFYDASDETFTLVVFRFRRQLEEEKEREEKERRGPRVVVFSLVVYVISRRPRTSSSSSTRAKRIRGKNTVTTALSDKNKNKVEVFVFIDCDNVRPRFSASDEEAAAQRFLHAFHRAASCYGDVVSLSLYGNEKTFGEEVQGDVKRGGEEEDEGEGEEGGWTRARTNERNTKKKSLGEALESVRILGSRVRVVRTQSRRKQSADIRCVSDVVDAMRKSADNETTTTTEKLRLAFIVSKDAGLLKDAASPYVRKRGDVVICGDFINNVGMREIDSHPIEDAYREVVEKKIGWSSGVKIKGKPGSEALAIGSRLVSWKDESVWFYAKSDEDVEKEGEKATRRERRRENGGRTRIYS